MESDMSTTTAAMPAPVSRGLPVMNGSCPTGIELHANQGGPVFINGTEAKLKKFNDNFYEARSGDITISISRNADGTMGATYNRPGKHGVCTLS
ncbi:hypothetical protein FGG78_23475 [Thioclava sp. BHET1]|nr:hypothetical protein FGG78_23475 [Thioclava sp. BHET1]